MRKPDLYSSDIENDFKSRDRDVSISIDTLEHNLTSDYKVLVQVEPPSVINEHNHWIPGFKNTIEDYCSHQQDFDLILAWHPEILDRVPNAVKFIFGDCWIDLDNYKNNKRDQISFITSYKKYAKGHKIRHEIYEYLKDKKHLNDFSIKAIKTPPRIVSKNGVFENAKFSIVVENEQTNNWITEKLIDCFATKTIPIYWGAPNVEEYFNPKGIFSFSTFEELVSILESLQPQTYHNLAGSIEDNYRRCVDYFDFHKRVDKEIDHYGSFV